MFGFGKKKPQTALDAFIFAVYGNPPPPKRANIEEAVGLACDKLLLGLLDREAVRENVLALAATPIPYSTHDLALSATLNFFKDPRYIPLLGTAQLAARIQAITWTKEGLVVAPLMKSFEDTLYKLYKPAPSARAAASPPTRKPIPAPNDQRHDLVRSLIRHRLSSEPVAGIAAPSLEQLRDDLPVEMLKQTSEFAILYIVEQFFQIRDTCVDEATAVRRLNELHSGHFSQAGLSLPMITPPFTLARYCRHYFDTIPSTGESLSDDFIDDALRMITSFYGH